MTHIIIPALIALSLATLSVAYAHRNSAPRQLPVPIKKRRRPF